MSSELMPRQAFSVPVTLEANRLRAPLSPEQRGASGPRSPNRQQEPTLAHPHGPMRARPRVQIEYLGTNRLQLFNLAPQEPTGTRRYALPQLRARPATALDSMTQQHMLKQEQERKLVGAGGDANISAGREVSVPFRSRGRSAGKSDDITLDMLRPRSSKQRTLVMASPGLPSAERGIPFSMRKILRDKGCFGGNTSPTGVEKPLRPLRPSSARSATNAPIQIVKRPRSSGKTRSASSGGLKPASPLLFPTPPLRVELSIRDRAEARKRVARESTWITKEELRQAQAMRQKNMKRGGTKAKKSPRQEVPSLRDGERSDGHLYRAGLTDSGAIVTYTRPRPPSPRVLGPGSMPTTQSPGKPSFVIEPRSTQYVPFRNREDLVGDDSTSVLDMSRSTAPPPVIPAVTKPKQRSSSSTRAQSARQAQNATQLVQAIQRSINTIRQNKENLDRQKAIMIPPVRPTAVPQGLQRSGMQARALSADRPAYLLTRNPHSCNSVEVSVLDGSLGPNSSLYYRNPTSPAIPLSVALSIDHTVIEPQKDVINLLPDFYLKCGDTLKLAQLSEVLKELSGVGVSAERSTIDETDQSTAMVQAPAARARSNPVGLQSGGYRT
ncbi:hypothetical protein GMRT_16299 [Giardia muris]|uniref:Uncharacterized protein n=1 Tax=Giardia muris TaxID=5742 RepID=A0A4Z1SXV5_GIAMU|nr:hypothetical protein GMRT_16299 [Giardia muris]|eukprot:TNJ29645.1 hypothetical protein GMRT_16299 [Giardia muris]